MIHLPRFMTSGALALLLSLSTLAQAEPASPPGTTPVKPPARATRPGLPARKPAVGAPRPASGAPAATRPAGVTADAGDLLDAVNANYRGFTTYDFSGTSHMLMTVAGQSQGADVPFRLAASRPAHVRNEIMNPAMSFVNVSNGAKTWTYLPQTSQYTEKDAAPLTTGGGAGSEFGAILASGTPIERYLSATTGLISARIVGEAAVDVGGTPVACTVVEARYASPDTSRYEFRPNTFWIDRARHLVVRDSVEVLMRGGPNGSSATLTTITTFSRLTINASLPDTLFTFIPPPGVQKVDAFQRPGMAEPISPLVGKPAPDFSVTDILGKKQRLSALKGRVVLLDFWATWCGPCRRELPTVAKLHKELAGRGLSVVAVNVGEPAATVNAYLKKNAFVIPVWLDTHGEVQAQYAATSIPTLVVIDRTGTVVSYKVGVREEAALRALLTEAGLE